MKDLLSFIFSTLLLYPAGWLYMHYTYRNENERARILLAEYDNSYTLAGKAHARNLARWTWNLIIIALVFSVAMRVLKHFMN